MDSKEIFFLTNNWSVKKTKDKKEKKNCSPNTNTTCVLKFNPI